MAVGQRDSARQPAREPPGRSFRMAGVEIGAKHGGLSTFNTVDGYLEAMFRGFRIDILRPEDYQAMTQQSETLDGERPRRHARAQHLALLPTRRERKAARPLRRTALRLSVGGASPSLPSALGSLHPRLQPPPG